MHLVLCCRELLRKGESSPAGPNHRDSRFAHGAEERVICIREMLILRNRSALYQHSELANLHMPTFVYVIWTWVCDDVCSNESAITSASNLPWRGCFTELAALGLHTKDLCFMAGIILLAEHARPASIESKVICIVIIKPLLKLDQKAERTFR